MVPRVLVQALHKALGLFATAAGLGAELLRLLGLDLRGLGGSGARAAAEETADCVADGGADGDTARGERSVS